MTTPEHTLVGIHLAMAVGVHSKLGWSTVVFAAIASNIPDVDGLPMLVDMERFESVHRVWGHNFLAIAITSILIAWTQSRFHWIEVITKRLARFLPAESQSAIAEEPRKTPFISLFFLSIFVQAAHLPCDMVVSGGEGLSDWLVFPFWPFLDWGFVYPLIPWGDIGPTVILMLGAIAIVKVPKRIKMVSLVSLLLLCFYLISRRIISI